MKELNFLDDMLTPTQVARYLQVSIRTLEAWRNQKRGPPYYHIGRSVRYSLTEVLAWMEQRKLSTAV